MIYDFILVLSLLMNGILFFLATRKIPENKSIGTLLILSDDVSKESYVALEFSEKELFSHPDGDEVIFKIEHRNANKALYE